MVNLNCIEDSDWLTRALSMLETQGYAVVEGVLADGFREQLRAAMYRARDRFVAEVGMDRIDRAGELGVLRLMFRFDNIFFKLLEIPELLRVVDRTVSETAILHLQNGFLLPTSNMEKADAFQMRYHQDFPRGLNGYVASINVLLAIDEFRPENGATMVVPGTQQKMRRPDDEMMNMVGVPVACAAGSMVIFDSTLWHAAGPNTSGGDRLAVNQQFTRSWIKQQVDYVRALGNESVLAQPPRTQQLLGWYTRVVASLDEYYQPAETRLYRGGQG